MNVLFMSLSDYNTIYFHGLYSDLLKQFVKHGDHIYIVSPFERSVSDHERIIREKDTIIVKVKILNMQKTNLVEKGISMLTIDNIFISAIKKYFSTVKFDLVLFPTPPITLLRAVDYIKRRDGAQTYLLLKDIFPQNAVDIGLMTKTGIKGTIYKYFRRQEKKLYEISDHIGCMSQANVEYVISHNPELDPRKIEVCPNSTDPIDMSCANKERHALRNKYGIPLDKKVFVYGGNLGKPQGISFIIDCLKKCQKIKEAFFLIVGNGTEYDKLEKYINEEKPSNVRLMQRLPKEDYDRMIGACDVGLIFLDHRFTIPNFPSRLLSYMQAKLPVLACTDPNTDIGKVIVDGGFGWWCESNDVEEIEKAVRRIAYSDLSSYKEKAYQYMLENYQAIDSYKTIVKHFV